MIPAGGRILTGASPSRPSSGCGIAIAFFLSQVARQCAIHPIQRGGAHLRLAVVR
jgi:hypothetical protein